MNREDIIRMAREAGWDDHHAQFDTRFQTFAALVASAEREAWEHKYARLQSLMDVRETQPNKPCCLAEREACAKVCDDDQSEAGEWTAGAHVGGYFAVRIRARGQA